MNAIEIHELSKRFGHKCAVNCLTMTVPVGAIYGFIGENGSGKSTTEKMITGLIRPSGGSIRLFGRPHTDPDVRARMGLLIETPGCFKNYTVWKNMQLQAANLGIADPDDEIRRILKLVHMEGSAGNKYRNCSLGMKQRIGIAMALLGSPELLVLDEPINGLDADGMRIMREVLQEMSDNGVTILISSHILGELEKIATHYGIIKNGRMIAEMTAEALWSDCRTYTALSAKDGDALVSALRKKYDRIEMTGDGDARVYDNVSPDEIVRYLYQNGVKVTDIHTGRISLEEYYMDLMKRKGDRQ